jgi:hypothetical protein
MSHKDDFSNEKNEARDWGFIILLLAFFIFVGSFFMHRDQNPEQTSTQPTQVDLNSKSTQSHRLDMNKLDNYMKDSQIREEINEQSTEVQNRAAPRVGDPDPSSYDGTDSVNSLSFDQDNTSQRVLRDTEGKKSHSGRPLTPDQRISAKLERDNWVKQHEKRQNEEFVRQFIENARQQGVDVRLNKNLDVTGLGSAPTDEPIRVPQSVSPGSK